MPLEPTAIRVACDSMVAMGSRTASGNTIFAKNSDRPAGECQPLLQAASADHAAGAKLACQYIEIEQVAHTYAFVGAGPYWLWGLEHGVNEHRVAIGNHTIFTKDAVCESGLQGMDLVRLGLERGASAAEALEAIVGLIERYGQGGSGYVDISWPYHNSFLIADPEEAWLLEASGPHWAARLARRGQSGLSASNHTTIGADWDRLSDGCVAHAREMGWWQGGEAERFDFAAAYRDENTVPPVVSSGRYATTCQWLGRHEGPLGIAEFHRAMRDHYGGGELHVPGTPPDQEHCYSVCMHADPVGTTTASMVVELCADPSRPLLAWMALASPCIGPYIPLFLEGEIPAALCRGGADPSAGGAWWQMKELLGEVEKDFAGRGPLVREFWREFEASLAARTEAVLAATAGAAADAAARAKLTDFMSEIWERTEAARSEILARIRAI